LVEYSRKKTLLNTLFAGVVCSPWVEADDNSHMTI